MIKDRYQYMTSYIYTPIFNHNIVCVANWNKSQFKIFPIFTSSCTPLFCLFNCINLSIEKFHVKAHFQNSTCISHVAKSSGVLWHIYISVHVIYSLFLVFSIKNIKFNQIHLFLHVHTNLNIWDLKTHEG